MAVQTNGHRQGQAQCLPRPGGRRAWGDSQRGPDRDRRPARPLQGDGGRGPDHVGRAGGEDRNRRALRPRVAQRPGGRRLRHVRPGDHSSYELPAGAGDGAGQRGQPGVRRRRVRAGDRHAEVRAAHRGQRSGPAPASAGTSTTSASPPGASGSSGPGYNANLVSHVDAGARRRRGEAARRRDGRRRRLRPGRVDPADGRRPTRARRSPASTTTRSRSSWPARRRRTAGLQDRAQLRGRPGRRPSRAPATT